MFWFSIDMIFKTLSAALVDQVVRTASALLGPAGRRQIRIVPLYGGGGEAFAKEAQQLET